MSQSFGLTLWKSGDDMSGVSMIYIGEGVVLETNGLGGPKPHYFEDYGKAVEFILRQGYALLSLGYEVYSDGTG